VNYTRSYPEKIKEKPISTGFLELLPKLMIPLPKIDFKRSELMAALESKDNFKIPKIAMRKIKLMKAYVERHEIQSLVEQSSNVFCVLALFKVCKNTVNDKNLSEWKESFVAQKEVWQKIVLFCVRSRQHMSLLSKFDEHLQTQPHKLLESA
jgi:hypothetical protein